MTFPPSFLIVQLFRKSLPRETRPSKMKAKLDQIKSGGLKDYEIPDEK
jgi:hypothetical protein